MQTFIKTGKNKAGETGKESSSTEGKWVLKVMTIEKAKLYRCNTIILSCFWVLHCIVQQCLLMQVVQILS